MKNNQPKAWTSAQCNRLIELWPQQLSCTEIGTLIGKSKGSVVSKRIQLGLSARAKRIRKDRAKSAKDGSVAVILNKVTNHRIRANDDKVISHHGVSMVDLGPLQCCYVLGYGKDRFASCCGLPVSRLKYCVDHYRECVLKRQSHS